MAEPAKVQRVYFSFERRRFQPLPAGIAQRFCKGSREEKEAWMRKRQEWLRSKGGRR